MKYIKIDIDGEMEKPEIVRSYLFGALQRAKRAGAIDEDAGFTIDVEGLEAQTLPPHVSD